MYNDKIPHVDMNIIITDSAADISCVGKGFQILFKSGETTCVGMALAKAQTNTFDIVTAAAVVIDPNTSRNIIIIINQAAHIPDLEQNESLLHTEQVRHHNVRINDLASCFHDSEGKPGRQSIEVDGFIIPLRHDGLKCFLHIREPNESDWKHCHIVELTSPESWSAQAMMRRVKKNKMYSDKEIEDWSERLGRLNKETVKHTLAATTQLINSVEAENRIVPRRHLKCRLPSLRPRRINEGFSLDTFFSDAKSSRGFTCAQIFVGVESGYTVIYPLKNKVYAYTALQDFIRYVGAPTYIKVDAARKENLGEWLAICRTYSIPQRTSEPGYQHQNKVERRIQDVKRRGSILMSTYKAPSRYWDYAVEYAVEIINHTAVCRLGWRTPYESLHGETPDISVFRFKFFEPIHYLNSNAQFPQPNMLPGRFMGIAHTTGDAFTFIVVTDGDRKGITLHRSVIRRRQETDHERHMIYDVDWQGCTSGNSSNEVRMDTSKGEDDRWKTIIEQTEGEEIIMSEAGHENPNTSMGTTHIEDGLYRKVNTEVVYDYYDTNHKCENIESIISTEFDPISGKLIALVLWDDGQQTHVDAEMIKRDDPMRLARHIVDKPAERLRSGYWNTWANETLNSISIMIRRIKNMYKRTEENKEHYPYSRGVMRRKKTYPIKRESFLGVEIPQNVREALMLDAQNKDGKWKLAMKTEIEGIRNHGTFLFLEPGAEPPPGYQEAPLRMIFAVKSDLRRKARLVAGGHKVDTSGFASYSSVVRMESTIMLNVIAKLRIYRY
jgi:hypothetical protein